MDIKPEKPEKEPNPPLLQKMVGLKSISFENGQFIMLGWPGIVFPLNTFIMIQKISEENFKTKIWDVLYTVGFHQGKQATYNLQKMYGFKQNSKFIDLIVQNTYLWGGGIAKLIRLDYDNKIFIVKDINTPLAKQYLKMYGIQKDPVDHFMRGIVAGVASVLFKSDKIIAIETKCISQGSPFCLFEAKEKSKWNLNDKAIKKQIPKKVIDPKIIEEKMDLKLMLANR